jgi:MtN3 and saliva related transmembrane protein
VELDVNRIFDFREVIGYLAGLLAAVAFLPQLLQTLRERSMKDISLGMYLLFCSGVTLWLIYGFLISSWPVVISNSVTLLLSGTILALKIRHG